MAATKKSVTRLDVIKRIALARLLFEFVDTLKIVFIRSSKSVSTFKTYQLRFAVGRKLYCNQGSLTEQHNRVIICYKQHKSDCLQDLYLVKAIKTMIRLYHKQHPQRKYRCQKTVLTQN